MWKGTVRPSHRPNYSVSSFLGLICNLLEFTLGVRSYLQTLPSGLSTALTERLTMECTHDEELTRGSELASGHLFICWLFSSQIGPLFPLVCSARGHTTVRSGRAARRGIEWTGLTQQSTCHLFPASRIRCHSLPLDIRLHHLQTGPWPGRRAMNAGSDDSGQRIGNVSERKPSLYPICSLSSLYHLSISIVHPLTVAYWRARTGWWLGSEW